MPHDVFISYSNTNIVLANAVVARLEEKGIRCWVAPRDIPAGSNFADSIVNAIEGCEVFVLIWSKDSNQSSHVLNEINRAFDEEKIVIPFRIDDVQPTKSMLYYLGRTHWLDAITPPMEKHIDELAAAILASSPKIREGMERRIPEKFLAKREKEVIAVKKSLVKWVLAFIGIISVILMIALWSRTSINQEVHISPISLTPSETISKVYVSTPLKDEFPVLVPPIEAKAPPTQTAPIQSVAQIGQCPLYVYEDYGASRNGFTPAGWMGDVSDITFDDNFKLDPERPNVIEIKYLPTGSNQFAGIYWWNPPDSNFGAIGGGFDISCATKLTFWAKGKNGGEKGEFKVGGIKGQYSDSLLPAVSSGPIVLTSNWVPYSIYLKGKNLTHIIGGFVWITNKPSNPNGATIYLDDIRFEP